MYVSEGSYMQGQIINRYLKFGPYLQLGFNTNKYQDLDKTIIIHIFFSINCRYFHLQLKFFGVENALPKDIIKGREN